jgi:broad-specificity NMP kinase
VALVSGPPGTGKTITVQLVAKALDLELVEWINPTVVGNWDSHADGSAKSWDDSVWKQFQEFLLRVQRYRHAAHLVFFVFAQR